MSRENKEQKNMMMQSEHPPKKHLKLQNLKYSNGQGNLKYKDGRETHFTPECWSMECPYSS
jgi:hypothetical protein